MKINDMNKLYILFAATVSFIAVSCSDGGLTTEGGNNTNAPIIGTWKGAVEGELMVKLSKDASMPSVALSGTSGNGSALLKSLNPSSVERVFPVDSRTEDRAVDAGLDRWHVVRFEGDLVEMAQKLSTVEGVEKVQYVHTLKRDKKPVVRHRSIEDVVNSSVERISRTAGNYQFNDPGLVSQWGLINNGRLLPSGTVNDRGDEIVQAVQGVDIGCEMAWKVCTGSPSIIVAVMDEGVMFNHPDLKANMWVNEAETFGSTEDADGNGFAGDRYGYNFVTNRGIITYDEDMDTGHGTHIAGVIAAVNNNGIGVSGIAGGNGTPDSGVKIMSLQVFANGKGVSMYQEARAIKYAADNGAVVLQCSWGYNSGLSNMHDFTPGYLSAEEWAKDAPLEKEALDYFIHNAGSPNGVIDGGIVVFAAGNESSAMAGFPGGHPDYISVASVAADGTPSNFSNYAKGVRISAPGGDSDYHKVIEGTIYSTLPPLDGSYYGYMEGTSMACPHVSGVAALGLSYATQLRKHFRAEEFRNLIVNSVSDASVESYFSSPKTYFVNYLTFGETSAKQMLPVNYKGNMGSGIVNAAKLLGAIEGAGVQLKVPNMMVSVDGTTKINFAGFFIGGDSNTYSVSVADGSVAAFSSADQVNFILRGVKQGSSKATVTASNGEKQEFVITVRSGNGWI